MHTKEQLIQLLQYEYNTTMNHSLQYIKEDGLKKALANITTDNIFTDSVTFQPFTIINGIRYNIIPIVDDIYNQAFSPD